MKDTETRVLRFHAGISHMISIRTAQFSFDGVKAQLSPPWFSDAPLSVGTLDRHNPAICSNVYGLLERTLPRDCDSERILERVAYYCPMNFQMWQRSWW